eukprot:11173388-Lingulodinium_polyedra.AAC.1
MAELGGSDDGRCETMVATSPGVQAATAGCVEVVCEFCGAAATDRRFLAGADSEKWGGLWPWAKY